METHKLSIASRNIIDISGVTAVVGFDDESVVVDTQDGRLCVLGSGLSILKLSVETGEVSAQGRIDSVRYTGDSTDKKGVLSRIFK